MSAEVSARMYGLLTVCLSGMLSAATHAAASGAPVEQGEASATTTPTAGSKACDRSNSNVVPTIDPLVFFDALVERYRRIELYTDISHLIESVQRDGETTSTTETQLTCEVRSGELRVETGSDQIRQSLGIQSPFPMTPMMRDMQTAYWLWLAPHMTLRFTDDPLVEFRDGVDDGFTPTRAEAVLVDEKPMVQIELRSSERRCRRNRNDEARFELYVDPESMLIERIEGQQMLPDGALQHTTLNITPLSVSDTTSAPLDGGIEGTAADELTEGTPTTPTESGPAASAESDDRSLDGGRDCPYKRRSCG